MKILITGSDGYIGTKLSHYLAGRNHKVSGLDTGFYRDGWLYKSCIIKSNSSINKDTRQVSIEDFKKYDAVVHLAELSNDPLGQINPKVTYEINHRGSVQLARLCKKAGVRRFVYSSSCSVYGKGDEEYVTENSSVNPQTAYAICKTKVERDVAKLADKNFSPVFLRNATVYGPSPRMRFDLVLNNLAGHAWCNRFIKMVSDGTPWRPLVHIQDICQAISCVLEAEENTIHNQIFNVGDTKENYQVKDIAKVVAGTFTGCKLQLGKSDGDNRSYKVSFEKIENLLPGFKCRKNIKLGAEELLKVFQKIDLEKETFESRLYTRIKQLKYLIENKNLNERLFWR